MLDSDRVEKDGRGGMLIVGMLGMLWVETFEEVDEPVSVVRMVLVTVRVT